MKIKNNVVHVEFKTPVNGVTHDYFGSLEAIFIKYDKKYIGASTQWLYKAKITPEKPFENKRCIIRRGTVTRKPGNRKPPVKVIRVGEV